MLYMFDLTRRADGSYVESCALLPNYGIIFRENQVTETDTVGDLKAEYEALVEHIQRIYIRQSLPVPIDNHGTDYPSRTKLLAIGETYQHNSFMVIQPTHAMFILLYNRMLQMGLTWTDVGERMGIEDHDDMRTFIAGMHLGSELVDNGCCQHIADALGCHIDIRLAEDHPSNAV